MKVLLWLMIPVAALIIGIIWASVRSRPPRPAAMQDSMASFSRFRRALATAHASSGPGRARPVGNADADGRPQGDLDEPAGSGTRPGQP
ncbi:MAG TPA: hypothetical protein VK662_11725 [Acidothermaceae bacterium]|jgi:hypothetical protein|nr:hypothetical protein [Acidothermaceae bacterium]